MGTYSPMLLSITPEKTQFLLFSNMNLRNLPSLFLAMKVDQIRMLLPSIKNILKKNCIFGFCQEYAAEVGLNSPWPIT